MPDYVIEADSVETPKSRLDKYQANQDVAFSFCNSELIGTGRCQFVQYVMFCCDVISSYDQNTHQLYFGNLPSCHLLQASLYLWFYQSFYKWFYLQVVTWMQPCTPCTLEAVKRKDVMYVVMLWRRRETGFTCARQLTLHWTGLYDTGKCGHVTNVTKSSHNQSTQCVYRTQCTQQDEYPLHLPPTDSCPPWNCRSGHLPLVTVTVTGLQLRWGY